MSFFSGYVEVSCMEGHLGLRKGAWTREEDVLLTNCVQKYGEGRWHQVPLRSGLNRCRKSCRLRWLNYLKPDLKRGEFAADEVDLIIRLHKLLGNRWSMIARRLPGRTSNDVKNYWNTHLSKKCSSSADHDEKTVKVTVIKPLPRLFTKDLSSHFELGKTTNDTVQAAPPEHAQPTKDQDDDVFMISTNNKPASSDLSEPYATPPLSAEVEFAWPESSFFDRKEEGFESDINKDKSPPCLGDGNNKENPISSSLDDQEVMLTPAMEVGGVDDNEIDWNQYFAFDMDLWDFLNGPGDFNPQ